MNTFEKAELTTSARNIKRFLKSGILIYNPKVQGTTSRKTRRRTQAVTKCLTFHANATKQKPNLLVE